VRREWVVFGFHSRKLGLDITYRRSESFQCIQRRAALITVHANISPAERGDGKRFIVMADEKLTAFLELERVTRESLRFPNAE
jgi:hypothetical protein